MCKQLKNLRNWFFKDIFHSIFIIFIFLLFISIFPMDMKNWKPTFYYPEVEYQLLENEVETITPEFNTVYHYKITSYNDENKSVKFKLYYRNFGEEPYLSVSIKNFGEENQEISYSRNSSNILLHTLRSIFFVLIVLILHFFIYVGFLCLLYLVCYFAYLAFNKIKYSWKKRYEEKLNKALEEMLAKTNTQNNVQKESTDKGKYEDSKSKEDEAKEEKKIEEK